MKASSEGRLSKNHRVVYDVVKEQGLGRHLSMAELFELARETRPGIGFTTVYRALNRLRDQGLIAEISLPGADSAYYELAAPPHAHFRCTACGSVDDVPFTLSDAVLEELSERLHAVVASASVSLDGRCANCAAL
jgi:Fe2+ or Zn2+ uptake regulation protein